MKYQKGFGIFESVLAVALFSAFISFYGYYKKTEVENNYAEKIANTLSIYQNAVNNYISKEYNTLKTEERTFINVTDLIAYGLLPNDFNNNLNLKSEIIVKNGDYIEVLNLSDPIKFGGEIRVDIANKASLLIKDSSIGVFSKENGKIQDNSSGINNNLTQYNSNILKGSFGSITPYKNYYALNNNNATPVASNSSSTPVINIYNSKNDLPILDNKNGDMAFTEKNGTYQYINNEWVRFGGNNASLQYYFLNLYDGVSSYYNNNPLFITTSLNSIFHNSFSTTGSIYFNTLNNPNFYLVSLPTNNGTPNSTFKKNDLRTYNYINDYEIISINPSVSTNTGKINITSYHPEKIKQLYFTLTTPTNENNIAFNSQNIKIGQNNNYFLFYQDANNVVDKITKIFFGLVNKNLDTESLKLFSLNIGTIIPTTSMYQYIYQGAYDYYYDESNNNFYITLISYEKLPSSSNYAFIPYFIRYNTLTNEVKSKKIYIKTGTIIDNLHSNGISFQTMHTIKENGKYKIYFHGSSSPSYIYINNKYYNNVKPFFEISDVFFDNNESSNLINLENFSNKDFFNYSYDIKDIYEGKSFFNSSILMNMNYYICKKNDFIYYTFNEQTYQKNKFIIRLNTLDNSVEYYNIMKNTDNTISSNVFDIFLNEECDLNLINIFDIINIKNEELFKLKDNFKDENLIIEYKKLGNLQYKRKNILDPSITTGLNIEVIEANSNINNQFSITGLNKTEQIPVIQNVSNGSTVIYKYEKIN